MDNIYPRVQITTARAAGFDVIIAEHEPIISRVDLLCKDVKSLYESNWSTVENHRNTQGKLNEYFQSIKGDLETITGEDTELVKTILDENEDWQERLDCYSTLIGYNQVAKQQALTRVAVAEPAPADQIATVESLVGEIQRKLESGEELTAAEIVMFYHLNDFYYKAY